MIITPWIHLRMRNVSGNFEEKIKTHILCLLTSFRKSCRLWDNVEKHDTTGLAIDDIIQPMLIACWITNAKNTHSEWVIHCFSTANMFTRRRPNISFIRTLPILFSNRTDLIQYSPALHFRIFKLFLICFPYCQSSIITKAMLQMQHFFLNVLLKKSSSSWVPPLTWQPCI